MSAYTGTVFVDRSPDEVFSFVRVPENQPQWAVNFVHSTREVDGGRYVMETPVGELTYRVQADDGLRTVDYVFETPAGDNILPSRVIPHATGALFTFTITRAPAMSDGEWTRGQRGLDEELLKLKEILESR